MATAKRLEYPVQKQLLTIYLSDHLSGATGVVQRLSRMTSKYTELSVHDEPARQPGG